MLAVAVCGVLGCVPSRAQPPPPPAAAPATAAPTVAQALPAPDDFRVALDSESRDVSRSHVQWRTWWHLQWRPVEGAVAYVVRSATSEGRGGRERRPAGPGYRLEVAAGTSPRGRVDVERSTQLSLTAAQLQVQVAAVGADGTVGEASLWFPVGEVPPDGRPVGSTQTASAH